MDALKFIPWLLIIFFILVAVRVALSLAGSVRQYRQTQTASHRRVPATVSGKRSENGVWYLTFETETGAVEFPVRQEEWDRLTEGDQGELVFDGIRFISFE